ncbi:MAG: hypothetical protein RMJ43_11660, partial [Chloroherpetonaceae bacterium]|nr:hypothetical protein [Chloroherpetonaceae bacterium]
MTSNHKPDPFTLTEEQCQRLLLLRARRAESEDEEGLEWLRTREQDVETLGAIARLLIESRFATGTDLNYTQMARLLGLVRSLAPNPNLDRRILHRPGEPDALNHDLRDWLYGSDPVPVRLERFLARRHIGGQTALQWLCAVYPQEWPLVTQSGLRSLQLAPEQHHAAVAQARQRYPADEAHMVPQKAVVWRLLAGVEIYRAVQHVLRLPDFVAVHRLLTQVRPGTRRARRALSALIHAPTVVHESRVEYAPPVTPHTPTGSPHGATAEPAPDTPVMPDIRDVRIEDV